MVRTDFKSILELLRTFPDEQSCIDHIESMRWPVEVISPFDPKSKVYKRKKGGYKCKNTNKYFNVKTGTMFENTKIPLPKWFLAIWLVTSHKKGISSVQLGKDINVTQKTAWFMLQRIRGCFGLENKAAMKGNIEIDETYVGGKNKNRHHDKKFKYSMGRSYGDKVAVFGMVERGGRMIAKVVDDVKGNTLKSIIFQTAKKGSMIHSDEWIAYGGLKRDYGHNVVTHSVGHYVDGNSHTNTIEGAWAILKRMVMGVYHKTTRKHLQKYVDEFVFRYNTRNTCESERFNLLLTNLENRITYEELTNGSRQDKRRIF